MATVTNTYTLTGTPSLYGNVSRSGVNQTLSAIRIGAGNDVNNSPSLGYLTNLTATTTSNQFGALTRSIFLFDTSSIPSGATIVSASLRIPTVAKLNNLGSDDIIVVSSNPASTSSLATGDFSTLGSTSFGSISYSNFTPNSTAQISLNSFGLANITKGGISKFGLVNGWDFSGVFTGGTWSSNAETSFTSTFTTTSLTIVYTVDFPTLSVNNISSLSNVTTITTS